VTHIPALDPSGRPFGRSFTAYDVRYHNGKWLEYGFTLVNEAPFPVIVDQIVSPGPGDPLAVVSVSISATGGAFGPAPPDQMIAFHPFSLPSHDARFVLIRERFSGCSLDGNYADGVEWATTPSVKYRFNLRLFTAHRTDFLPLAYSVHVWGHAGCP
jgi:hypothetical protein